jgi:hypothetical protein
MLVKLTPGMQVHNKIEAAGNPAQTRQTHLHGRNAPKM